MGTNSFGIRFGILFGVIAVLSIPAFLLLNNNFRTTTSTTKIEIESMHLKSAQEFAEYLVSEIRRHSSSGINNVENRWVTLEELVRLSESFRGVDELVPFVIRGKLMHYKVWINSEGTVKVKGD